MKMEHVVMPSAPGRVVSISVKPGDIVDEGQPLVLLELVSGDEVAASIAPPDLDHIRGDLAEVLERQRLASDEARAEHDPAFPRRVARRRKQGQRTARENVADLTDPGSFVEYAMATLGIITFGPFLAQKHRVP